MRAEEARADADRRSRDAGRHARITAASRGTAQLQVGRAAALRDSASIASAVLGQLEPGVSVEALTYDGRYWGVRTADGQTGYVQGSALDYTASDVSLVTTGARLPVASPPAAASGRTPAPARTAAPSGTASSRSTGSARRTATRSAVCADYRTQAAAQAAYRADPVGLSELDGNSNGTACEDHFRARPRATPRRQSRPAAGRTCYTGPRGGRYYISASGRRVYGC